MEAGQETPMYDTQSFDVFLSYNSEDKSSVDVLASRLEKAGLRVWLDKWHLVPGAPWQEAIEGALDRCQTYAVIIGPSGFGPWQHEEMRAALDKRVKNKELRVIPVLLPDSKPGEQAELKGFLGRYTWVDFRRSLDDQVAFDRHRGGRIVRDRHAPQLPDQPLETFLQQRVDQRRLVAKVVVDRRRGVAAALREPAHRESLETALDEQLLGGVQDRAPGIGAVPASSLCGGLGGHRTVVG